jgi:predicted butyrate kinase (DUF1464 family)
MALIKCSECGKDISDKAAACPGCGAPISTAEPSSALIAETTRTVRVVRAGLRYEAIGFFLILGAIVVGLAGASGFAGFLGFVGFIVFMIGRFID